MNAGLRGRPALASSRCAAKLNASGGGSTEPPFIGVSLAPSKSSRGARATSISVRRPAVMSGARGMAFASSLCNIVLNSSLRGRRNLVKQCAVVVRRRGNRGARRSKRPLRCARRTGRGGRASGRSGTQGPISGRARRARASLARAPGPDPQGARAADRRFRAAPGQSRIWRRQRFDPGAPAGGARRCNARSPS